MRNKVLLIISIMLFSSLAIAKVDFLIGTWEVSKVVKFGGSLNPSKTIGDKILINKKQLIIFNKKYNNVTYHHRIIDNTLIGKAPGDKKYGPFYDIKADRKKLDIIEVKYKGKRYLWFEKISNNQLLYKFDGHFYFLKK